MYNINYLLYLLQSLSLSFKLNSHLEILGLILKLWIDDGKQ